MPAIITLLSFSVCSAWSRWSPGVWIPEWQSLCDDAGQVPYVRRLLAVKGKSGAQAWLDLEETGRDILLYCLFGLREFLISCCLLFHGVYYVHLRG